VRALTIFTSPSEKSYENIKITTPEDLAMAEAILKKFDY